MNSLLFETGLPAGVVWTPKIVPKQHRAKANPKKKKSQSLSAINKHMAATRTQRLADAQENCSKLTGKRSF